MKIFRNLTNSKSLVPSIFMLLMGVPHVGLAQESLALKFLGVATIQNPEYSSGSASSIDGKTSFGIGAGAEFSLSETIGIEVDILALNHKFSRDTAEFFGTEASNTYSSSYIQVPVLLKYHPVNFFNVGAGIYYSRIYSSWTVSVGDSEASISDFEANDLGFVLSLGAVTPLGGTFAVVSDLRLAHSISELSRDSGDVLQFSDIQALVGLQLTLD